MKENKKRKIAMLLTLLGVTSIVIGTTFAIYENTINTNKNHIIKTGVVNFTLTESTNGLVLNNLQELTDYEGMAQEEYYEFTIKNTGDTKTDYEISLVDKPNSSYTGTILNEKYIKVGLLKNNSKEIIVNLKDVNRLIDKVTLDVDKSANYKLRLWLDLKDITDEAKEALVGQKIFLVLKINGIQSMENITIATDKLIALTNNQNESGLYTITHPKDTTLQIGNDKDITEYRYRGASPKNYVTFNNEVWRILGVFPTDDGTGNIENRIKIVRNENIGNKRWDTTGLNNWARPATLNTELNTTYLNSLTREAQSMIGDAKYYLGGITPTSNNGYTDTPLQFYSYERKTKNTTSNEFYYGTYPNSWVGKLSLMYVSDYGYASSNCENKRIYGDNDIRGCNNTNWLYNIKIDEWLLPQYAGSNGYTFLVGSAGLIDHRIVGTFEGGVRPVLYLTSSVQITGGNGTSTDPYVIGMDKQDASGANAPVLASNMIPVYYDEAKNVWKCADKENKDIITRWYHYDYNMWANAVTINYSDSSIKNKYFNSDGTLKIKPGEEVLMDDITTMWVWIPRFNAVTPSNYNGGTKAKPNAIDVTFVKSNETALDAFTFGNKELSGFWYGKFETSHATLTSSTVANNLGCSNETCSNANGLIVKPNVKNLRNNNVSNFFYASRSMEQINNSFGFVKDEVDTHMSKNNEWGAVAYLTQSIYGRCTSSTNCPQIGINNNTSYITGYGAPAGSSSSTRMGTYNTTLGKNASTTGNMYGIYDMSGGMDEYVMGVLADTNGNPRSGYSSSANSGFTGMLGDGTTYTGVSFPDSKYYNLYTGSSYTGHALTETAGWYSNTDSLPYEGCPWFVRGGSFNGATRAGVFNFSRYDGNSGGINSTRMVVTNE